ncbi:MAG: hypothetical protein D6731_01125 [Planctomycetota bacterium]|nr:MAG: hypothetical protein D6731_01125 [Planctomycetota bacterium]
MSEGAKSLLDALRAVARRDGRYPVDAYRFLFQALDLAQRLAGEQRHVSGPELLEGVRRLAIEQFGSLALMVLRHWNLHRCEDIGTMVFVLTDAGLMSKTEEDSMEDFRGGYSFREAFCPDRLAREVDARALAPAPRLRPTRALGNREGATSQPSS